MKPEEYDVVRLLKSLPEYNLPAGSQGAVVTDYKKYGGVAPPNLYEVEFTDDDGLTKALITIPEDDLEVVWRPSAGSETP